MSVGTASASNFSQVQLGNVGNGGYSLSGDTDKSTHSSGSVTAGGAASSANSLTAGDGATINFTQESPAAIAALAAGTSMALTSSHDAMMGGFALAGQLGNSALEKAAAALQPADERLFSLFKYLAGAIVIGLLLFLYIKRRG